MMTNTFQDRVLPDRRVSLAGVNLMQKFEGVPQNQNTQNKVSPLPPKIIRSKSVSKVSRRASLSKSPVVMTRNINPLKIEYNENKENLYKQQKQIGYVEQNQGNFYNPQINQITQHKIKNSASPSTAEIIKQNHENANRVIQSKILHRVRTSTKIENDEENDDPFSKNRLYFTKKGNSP